MAPEPAAPGQPPLRGAMTEDEIARTARAYGYGRLSMPPDRQITEPADEKTMDHEMAVGALAAIRELLDEKAIPSGIFPDEQVRNLVILYSRRGAEIERLEDLVAKWRDETSTLLARTMSAELAAARARLTPRPMPQLTAASPDIEAKPLRSDEPPPDTTDSLLAILREHGWTVAVHNDYRLDDETHMFWLLTHPTGGWIKGEATSDVDALRQCVTQIGAR